MIVRLSCGAAGVYDAAMLDAPFEHHYAEVPGVRLHYLTLGAGSPVLLIHGWPQTSYEWRKLMPLLADRYQLFAPDLRGLGDSSRPRSGYDKATIAGDLFALMHDVLGHARFAVIGHDWGAPTAFRLAADHPDAVSHLALLDVGVPGDQPRGAIGGGARWHHQFHQVPDLPEALTYGRERLYLEFFFQNGCDRAGAIRPEDVDEYARTYRQPGAMRAGFELYRALPRDVEANRATLESGFRLPMPTLGLGGGGRRGRGEIVVESVRRVAKQPSGGSIPDCGHFIPEEAPQELASALRALLGS